MIPGAAVFLGAVAVECDLSISIDRKFVDVNRPQAISRSIVYATV